MKNRIKKKLKLITLFSLVLLSGCEKDSNEEMVQQKKSVIIKNISLKEIYKSGKNSKLIEAVEQVKNKRNITNSNSKLTFDDTYGFYIDTENGKSIETTDGTNYTFEIYRDSPSTQETENIVFSINNQNDCEIYTSKYLLSDTQIQSIANKEDVDLSNVQTEIRPLGHSSATSRCMVKTVNHIRDEGDYYVVTYIYTPCTYAGTGGTGSGTGSGSGTGTGGTGTGIGSGTGIGTGSGTGTGGTSTGTGIGTASNGHPTGGGGGVYTTPVITPGMAFIYRLSEMLRESILNLSPDVRQILLNYLNLTTTTFANQATVRNVLEYSLLDYFWYLDQSTNTQSSIFNYLIANKFSSQSVDFVNQYISNSVANPDLQIDFNLSTKSPAFIDMSSVSGNSPEEIKFREVYNSLTQSPMFKKLFIDMFQNNTRFNIKFLIETPTNNTANGSALAILSNPTLNTIKISPTFLQNNNKLFIAKTILHECIHAYLNVKLCEPAVGMSIPAVNNMDFIQTINSQYNGFINDQAQHNFIYNHMLPTMVQVLSEIKGLVLTPVEIQSLEELIFSPPPANTNIPFNWNTFLHNISLGGLQNCPFFQNEIGTFVNGNIDPKLTVNEFLLYYFYASYSYANIYLRP